MQINNNKNNPVALINKNNKNNNNNKIFQPWPNSKQQHCSSITHPTTNTKSLSCHPNTVQGASDPMNEIPFDTFEILGADIAVLAKHTTVVKATERQDLNGKNK
jgi:hypothetical protein